MKLLIAYDGSECARQAIEDLQWAGLPEKVEAKVLHVGEAWPYFPSTPVEPMVDMTLMQIGASAAEAESLEKTAADNAREIAEDGAERLRKTHAAWLVETQWLVDTPSGGIIAVAEQSPPDLVLVGSHGKSAVERVFFGSVSQKVVKYCPVSVRIGRGASQRHGGPPRMVIGIDGSPGSEAAVRHVLSRNWPQGTSATVLMALEQRIGTIFSAVTATEVIAAAQDYASSVSRRLCDAGLSTEVVVVEQEAKRALLQAAENVSADCIFVGARGMTQNARFLLGTVSASVAARAHCSVEVVRG